MAEVRAVKQRLALLSQSEGEGGIDWSDESTTEIIAKVHISWEGWVDGRFYQINQMG